MIKFSEFSYTWTYTTRDRIFGENSLIDVSDFFDVNDPEFRQRVLAPRKRTHLHALLEFCIEQDVDWAISKLDSEVFAADELVPLLASYEIEFPGTPQEFELPSDESEEDREYLWAHHLQAILAEKLTPCWRTRYLRSCFLIGKLCES